MCSTGTQAASCRDTMKQSGAIRALANGVRAGPFAAPVLRFPRLQALFACELCSGCWGESKTSLGWNSNPLP